MRRCLAGTRGNVLLVVAGVLGVKRRRANSPSQGVRSVLDMSTKATKPGAPERPEVVVENLRSAVHASEGELARRRKVLALATRAPIVLTVLYGLTTLR